jgi:hypothetical protein
MAILDLVHASGVRGVPQKVDRPSRQLSPAVVGWMLRITTIVLLLVASLVGFQLAMNAPTVSPDTVIGQEQVADGQA